METRREVVDQFELSVDALTKSWFVRRDGSQVVFGQVLCEPQPGMYLVDLEFDGHDGPTEQRVVTIKEMASDEDWPEWRFFDSRKEARARALALRAVV
jgi:hypothetical protein